MNMAWSWCLPVFVSFITNSMKAVSKLVVLISGNGSNLQAILDACASGELPAQVVAVISNKGEAYGLERARQAGVFAVHKPKFKQQDRREYDSELADQVASFQPDWVILAGWMRVLSSTFLDFFPGRVINLHPAMPGTFPGVEAIQRAYEAYRKGEIQHTGVMVHLVPDEGVDAGPVLAQQVVPIYSEDSLEMLETRIHIVEHELLVKTIRRVLAEADFVMNTIGKK
jgi:phosphoribosylglycinamide formyltransferase-1